MTPSSTATASSVWFLVGPYDSAESVRYLPIYTRPFLIGRRQGLALTLNCKTVSNTHAEITESDGKLMLRDLGSTNGTYVNGRRVTEPVALDKDDMVQFANMAFRVRHQAAHDTQHTVQESACDQAMALVQFDKLMAERAVTPFFQPIVSLENRELLAFEVLARSRLFGLETPKDMFTIAGQLNLEIELSTMLRWEGVQSGQSIIQCPNLFLNTHPRELTEPRLVGSLRALRQQHPHQELTLEIHESAVADARRMAELRPALRELNIALAYDDFGTGQSRFQELAEDAPDYVKFDMSLIRGIDSASPQRQQVVATLVKMVAKLGVHTLAEGVETEAEDMTCRQMGFELGQGFLYGRPAPPRASVMIR